MDLFTPVTQRWFVDAFAAPTPIQTRGWAEIAAGEHALLLAPTGSGKTLAAFLWGIDRVVRLASDAPPGVRVLYVSPLKALAHDIERNLRGPLIGIQHKAAHLGLPLPRDIRVDVRTGDTPTRERARQQREPADILVTTPESLFLLLGSKARETLRSVHTVIVDEVHALAPSKRGVHLALSLERLTRLVTTTGNADPQRIGLSATVRPASRIAEFLGGVGRRVAIVDAIAKPALDLTICAPISELPRPAAPPPSVNAEQNVASELYFQAADDTRDAPPRPPLDAGIWPALYARAVELVRAHRATILFVNSRSVCERLAGKINEYAGEDLVRAHHGSVSHEQRKSIEESLKRGTLRGIVATSSLELGIDMGSVDLVVCVESPGSVARGLQRVGRAGHEVGGTSRGVIFPKQRADLLECAVVAQRMLQGEVESLDVPQNALDVLAQQIVAMVVDAPLTVADLESTVRRAMPFRALSKDALVAVLDMLSGRFPSDEFADLRPRLAWDRSSDELRARRGTPMVSRLNAGTIPDRGLFGVYHVAGERVGGGGRVGELDEEMVHETRVGDIVVLGASSWRVAEITRDRVMVEPAPGEPGRLPFWRGDGPGRPIELGRAMGRMLRDLATLDPAQAVGYLRAETPLDAPAASSLAAYVAEQRAHTGGALPTDRAITIERFRDELGDWRVVILTPFGGRVHAPWSIALQTLLSRRAGFEVVTMHSDDGIVLTFADGEELPDVDALVPDPDELEELVTEQLAGSALFGTAFRENAGRALLLPKRSPGKRTPLWSQRLRSKSLLAAVQRYADFPIVLETYRECLRDVFDLPALAELLRKIRSREIHVDEVETHSASPFAQALVFRYVAAFMYEYDAPLAERRAQVLTLDRALLRDLLGHAELREILDADALAEVEAELQRTAETRQARDADELHDVLRTLGALDETELAARTAELVRESLPTLLGSLSRQRRAVQMRVAGKLCWIAAQDAGIYVHALGAMPPSGLPDEFLDGGTAPFEFLVRRYARTHGPFTTAEITTGLALAPGRVEPLLARLEAERALVRGALRPGGGDELEWCDEDVLRRIKRRTLAKLRGRVAAASSAAFARFSFAWHGLTGEPRAGLARLREVTSQLEGLALPWSAWLQVVLPARVADFQPEQLDMLCAAGELVWIGRGALGARDGRVMLCRRENAAVFASLPPIGGLDAEGIDARSEPQGAHAAVIDYLRGRGASFTRGLREAVGDADFEAVLRDLIWSGVITNDTTAPLRAIARGAERRTDKSPRGLRALRSAPRSVANAGGRWSLVEELFDAAPADPVTAAARETERRHELAATLLARYGVLSREMAQAEEITGGIATIAGVLELMEDAGRVRRGHFVAGLTGRQYALAGALDRLRAAAELDEAAARGDDAEYRWISAIDPANVFGALVPWPAVRTATADVDDAALATQAPSAGGLRRVAGAWLLCCDGEPLLYVAASRRSITSFAAAEDPARAAAAFARLRELPRQGRGLLLERIDGVAVDESPLRFALERAGFVRDYQGWMLREVYRGA